MYLKFLTVSLVLLLCITAGLVFSTQSFGRDKPNTEVASTSSTTLPKLFTASAAASSSDPKHVVKDPVKTTGTPARVPTSPVTTGSSSSTRPIKTPRHSSASTSLPVAQTFTEKIEIQIHVLVNEEREKSGQRALLYDTRLSAVARSHSSDMLTRRFFSHDNPDGCSMTCRIQNIAYAYRVLGENIYMVSGRDETAKQTAQHIVEAWMSSTGHRANILSDNFTAAGVGIAKSENTIYATQNFAKPR